MKILFVITSLEIGGAQTFLLRLYEYLQNQGNEVYLLNLHFSKHQLGSGNLKNAFHFHPPGHLNLKIKSYIIRKPISQLRFKAQVNFAKKIINQVKPDIINSHLWFADYVVFETLKKNKKNSAYSFNAWLL
jgi:UDP-N-acetylglucosamine:LPS N-acetylglucosamine transferase